MSAVLLRFCRLAARTNCWRSSCASLLRADALHVAAGWPGFRVACCRSIGAVARPACERLFTPPWDRQVGDTSNCEVWQYQTAQFLARMMYEFVGWDQLVGWDKETAIWWAGACELTFHFDWMLCWVRSPVPPARHGLTHAGPTLRESSGLREGRWGSHSGVRHTLGSLAEPRNQRARFRDICRREDSKSEIRNPKSEIIRNKPE